MIVCATCKKQLSDSWLEVVMLEEEQLEKSVKVCNADCIPERKP